MADSARSRALKNYRERLTKKGMARFEVVGAEIDRTLIRSIARRLALDDAAARRLRSELQQMISESDETRGGVFAALRRSPLVGVDLDLTRERTTGRRIDL